MYEGNCHCGAVNIRVLELPDCATQCNCSICRRYAALWSFCTEGTVEISAEPSATRAYRWGDGYIDFHHCVQCGCVTHYTSTGKAQGDRVGVNLNMFAPTLLAEVQVRRFDGADTWEYLE